MESEERRGRVPVELPTGDAAPGATVSHFSLFLPTPIHFPSPTFLIFTRESRGATVSPGEVGVRGAARQGGEHWGKKKRRTPHSECHLCLPRSHPRFIPHSRRLQRPAQLLLFFFSHPAAKCVKLTAWVRLLPPRLVLSPRGKHAVLSQPSSLTTFPSHSGVIKKRATGPPPPLSLLSIPSGVFFSSPHRAVSREAAV